MKRGGGNQPRFNLFRGWPAFPSLLGQGGRPGLRLIIAGGLLLVMTAVMATNYIWTSRQQRQQALLSLRAEAQVITAQFMSTRAFIAAHQDRINYDSQGRFEFKHLNPAAVGKGVADLLRRNSDYSIKQTRLAARDPENAPDAFERQALIRFSREPALKEIFAPDTVNGLPVYRYLLPMYAEEACLECHGEPKGVPDVAGYPREGLHKGELAGALSITVPAERFYAALWTHRMGYLGFTLALLLVTVLTLYLLLERLVLRPLTQLQALAVRMGQGDLAVDPERIEAVGEIRELAGEFGAMARQLRRFYEELERRVQERTAALQEANRQLDQANRLQAEFLANMTHEVRTPLTSIIAFTELLLNQVLGETNQEQRQALRDIQESAQQLLTLVNDLLDLTRIEAGRMELHREAVDPLDLLQSCARTVAPLAQAAQLHLEVDVPPELPLIDADPDRLRQVVLNLLSNALKFTPPGGRICLKARAQGEEITVSVSDTGIGIRPEDQGLIFEKFRQVDGSATRRYRGAGLGLALSRHLVEMHGGRIWVQSRPGEGSTFGFTVPSWRGHRSKPSQPAARG